MKEKKKPKVLKSFEELRPNSTINCFFCLQVKEQIGSRKFRAHHVCSECVLKLETIDSK